MINETKFSQETNLKPLTTGVLLAKKPRKQKQYHPGLQVDWKANTWSMELDEVPS